MAQDKRKVFVTGATGMIGFNLARSLAPDFKVFFFCRPSADKRKLSALKDFGAVLFGDVTDRISLRSALTAAQPDLVYHLASTRFNVPLPPETHFEVILWGAMNLLEVAREIPGVRLVFTGSAAEYGSGAMLAEDHPLRPATVLGAAKASASVLAETYKRLYSLSTVIVRLFTPYGPWEDARRLVPQTVLSALASRDIAMTKGDQQRDFVYVDDVVEALLLAGACELPQAAVFNIGSGMGTPVREIVRRIQEIMRTPVKAQLGAIPTRHDEIMEMSADITFARHALGWQPKTSLDQGLRKSIEWIVANRNSLQ